MARGSRTGRRSGRVEGGKTGEEEAWAWGDKGERRRSARGRRRSHQGIRLGIAPQRKGWRGGLNKGRGIHRCPGGSWKVGQD